MDPSLGSLARAKGNEDRDGPAPPSRHERRKTHFLAFLSLVVGSVIGVLVQVMTGGLWTTAGFLFRMHGAAMGCFFLELAILLKLEATLGERITADSEQSGDPGDRQGGFRRLSAVATSFSVLALLYGISRRVTVPSVFDLPKGERALSLPTLYGPLREVLEAFVLADALLLLGIFLLASALSIRLQELSDRSLGGDQEPVPMGLLTRVSGAPARKP